MFQAANKVAGEMGTFHFSDGFEGVRITNASDKDLVLHSITVAPRSPSGQTPVVFAGGNSHLQYDLGTDLLPTVLEVNNLGTGDIVPPDGEQIDNPAGEAHLQNPHGGIVTGPLGTFVLRTHQLGGSLRPTAPLQVPGLVPARFGGVVQFNDNGDEPDTISHIGLGNWERLGFKEGDLILIEAEGSSGVHRIADIGG